MLATFLWLAMMQQSADLPEQTYNPTVVDPRHINACDSYLGEVAEVTGPVVFRRLYFVSEALRAADTGATEAKRALVKQRSAKNYTEMWAASLNGEEAWEDHMLCAAQIMGRYAPLGDTGNPESVIASLLVVAFNQEAHAIATLAQSQKRRFTRQSAPTTAEEFADAEELHGIESEQNDAVDSIRKVTMLVAAETADMAGPEDKTISKLQLTCRQKLKIDALLKPVSLKTDTLFGSSAHQMLSMLDKLTCQ